METHHKTVALIVAAGSGTRTGSDVPKQFAMLCGKSVISHSVDAFQSHPDVDDIYIVVGAGQQAALATALGPRTVAGIIIGGAERHHSVRAGLDAIGSAHRILIHDAARPLVPHIVINRLLEAIRHGAGAVPALPVVDTLACGSDCLGKTVDRSGLLRIQTPQAFQFDAIMTSHKSWHGGAATDDAQIAREAGYEIAIVDGDIMLEKITHAADFDAVAARAGGRWISRCGTGYDVHQMVEGKELWLCGLLIKHDRGLSGHSDADVALHAITDALLGAIAEGDIGDHFPPSDNQWKGAASSIFMQYAAKLIANRGAQITNIDVTIICEEPRIGPHRVAMRHKIAEILAIDVNRISVKATTTEGLGFTGRREGIAAHAIATVSEREL